MRIRSNKKGNAFVELALALPLTMLILFGVMDFARAFSFAEMVAGAARAGVQFGYRSPGNAADATGIENAARAEANNLAGLNVTSSTFCTCNAGGSAVACNATCSGSRPMRYVQVDTNYRFRTLLQYATHAFDDMTLNSRAVMRVE
jgi:Flp pilus assembly protein TadG